MPASDLLKGVISKFRLNPQQTAAVFAFFDEKVSDPTTILFLIMFLRTLQFKQFLMSVFLVTSNFVTQAKPNCHTVAMSQEKKNSKTTFEMQDSHQGFTTPQKILPN
jgi:hypothetical protein